MSHATGQAGTPEPARRTPRVLFTAFEPSGDDHAQAVIRELLLRHPGLRISAWGGPRMAAAGAEVIERTGDDAVMGLPGLKKLQEHRRINERIDQWLDQNKIDLHVPVDSPAANFPICAMAKARGIKVVHLVAPQIWAWARWRIHKLRRLTNRVLCVLPFEEKFFVKRDVPATFIGHFLFDEPVDEAALDVKSAELPSGSPRIAIMPGSRPDELRRNYPMMLEVFAKVRAKHPGAIAVVAATRPAVAEQLQVVAAQLADRLGLGHVENNGWPESMRCVVGATDVVIRWCELALVKSGTVTMQVAKQLRPMVIVYKKSNPLLYYIVKAIMATKLFTLPNVIAHREIVPEFVPHFGGPEPIVRAVLDVIEKPEVAGKQREELNAIVSLFAGRNARRLAADEIEKALGLK
ncbi:MAG: lipid-A-disaccharide synthase [Phycisphaerales bacterium]|nr:lipid-A-disaccharide synthase [Phycisphaerales bacterium]